MFIRYVAHTFIVNKYEKVVILLIRKNKVCMLITKYQYLSSIYDLLVQIKCFNTRFRRKRVQNVSDLKQLLKK